MKKILILIMGAALLVIVGAVALILTRKRRGTKIQPPPEQPGPVLDEVILNGIKTHALRFIGLYEGLYTAVQTQSVDAADAYKEWHIRMGNLHDDEAFRNAFCTRFPREGAALSHLQELLVHVEAAGICRSTETVHVAGPRTREQYIYMGAGDILPGKEYKVLRPCWLQDEVTVQQGLLIPKEGM